MSAGQLWLVQLLRIFSGECTAPLGHVLNGTDSVVLPVESSISVVHGQKCLLRIARTPSPDVHSISTEDIFALEELSFNETRREKTPIFVDARHLLSQWVRFIWLSRPFRSVVHHNTQRLLLQTPVCLPCDTLHPCPTIDV